MVIVALDVGERRIGLAVSDPTGRLASPRGVIERRSRAEDFAAVARLVHEAGAGRVLVGLPLSLDGQMGPQARRVARYARALAATLDVPLELVDERYSTVTADALLAESDRASAGEPDLRGIHASRRGPRVRGDGRSGRRPHTAIDAAAAAVILQEYLDRMPASGGSTADPDLKRERDDVPHAFRGRNR